jgi:hypothetical protein
VTASAKIRRPAALEAMRSDVARGAPGDRGNAAEAKAEIAALQK